MRIQKKCFIEFLDVYDQLVQGGFTRGHLRISRLPLCCRMSRVEVIKKWFEGQ